LNFIITIILSIDVGLVATLEKGDRRNFIEVFAAVVQNDGKRVRSDYSFLLMVVL
jgi:predicted unusual protein kinase regulating ubiquinone biosynthesis (AarF/ABC1/UbiB family)